MVTGEETPSVTAKVAHSEKDMWILKKLKQ